MQLSISIIQNSERLLSEMFLKSQKFVVVILLLYKILADADDVANERIQKLERELAEVKCENNQLRDVCCEFGYKASLAEVMILEDFKFILRKNFKSLSQAAPNGSNQWTQFNPQNACPPFTLHVILLNFVFSIKSSIKM